MSDDSRREGARGPALDSPQPADSPPSSPSPHDPTVEMEGSSSAIAGPSGASGLSSTSDDLDSPPAGPLLLEGEVLAGRYCVRQFLARGGGGEVYEAEDLELGGRVALKILASGPAGDSGSRSERFRREIQLARRVTHPNVCRLYEFGRHTRRGTPDAPGAREFLFITMELLRGPTLAQHLLDNGPLAPDEALPIVRQLATALDAAHQAGVVHRDFKSANVILVPDDKADATTPSASAPPSTRAVVTDFGLARAHLNDDLGPTVTANGLIVGSPAYMAPEQVEGGPITPAADIYALGVVLYEMATGAFPFSGESALSIAVKRLREAPVRPSARHAQIDPRWERVILRCLERQPEERYPDAQSIAAALDPSSPMPRPSGRRGWLLWTGLGTAAAFGLVAYLALRPGTTAPPVEGGQQAPRRSVAVLGFENLTRQADADWLATAFSEMLDAELGEGGALRVVSGETIARVRHELGVAQVEAPAADTLERLRTNLGSDYLLTGSYLAIGPPGSQRLRLQLRLQDTLTGDTLHRVELERPSDELFQLADDAGLQLRTALEVPDSGVAGAERDRRSGAIPADPAAARFYAEGLAQLREGDGQTAVRLLEQAIRVAPEHALAHSALAEGLTLLGYEKRALEEARTALLHSAGLPSEDRLLIEALVRQQESDWEQALALYSSLYTLQPDDPEHLERLGRTYISASRWRDAVELLRRAEQANPTFATLPRLALIESLAKQRGSDFEGALAAAERAAQVAERSGATSVLARAQQQAGQALASLGRRPEARAYYDQARLLFLALGDRQGTAMIDRSIAVIARQQGDLDGAAILAERSLSELRAIGSRRLSVVTLNTLANIRYDQNRFEDAAALYEEALAIGREIEDTLVQAVMVGNLANVSYLQGQVGKALIANREALRFKRELHDDAGTATSLLGLATVQLDAGEPKAALTAANEALTIAQRTGNQELVASARLTLAGIHTATGRLAEARSEAVAAHKISSELEDPSGAAKATLARAEVALEEGRWEEVLEAASAAHTVALAKDDTDVQLGSIAALVVASLELGHTDEADAWIQKGKAAIEDSPDVPTLVSASIGMTAATARARLRQGTSPAPQQRQLAELENRAAGLGLERSALEARCARLALTEAGAGASGLAACTDRAVALGYQSLAARYKNGSRLAGPASKSRR